MSRVLILMATWNGAAHLRQQLDSIAGQSHGDWELWVSDDGSSDETCKIIQHFANDVPQAVHLTKGPGQGAARNFLSLLCHADLPLGPNTYVAFSDQDDVWYPDKLCRALTALEPIKGPAIYGAGYDLIDPAGAMLGHAPALPKDGLRPLDPFLWTTIGGLTSMLSPKATELARAAGKPDVPYHDWWLSLVVAACGGQQIGDPARVLGYRQHDANVIGASGRRGAARRRIAAVLDGTYGDWVQANMRALLEAPLPLTDTARDVAKALAQPAGGLTRAAMMRRYGLRRRDRLSTLAAYLAALSGRL